MKTSKQLLTNGFKRNLEIIRQVWHREEGVNLVIFAFIMMVLMGFSGVAIDGGNAYQNQQQVQIAADAAAMGGARLLAVDATPEAVALEIQNLGIANGADVVTFTYLTGNRGVHVTATANVTTFFAKLYGYDFFTVSAEAQAEYQPVGATEDLFPMTMGCDCVDEGTVTLVDGEEEIEETEEITETLDLIDDVDTTYEINFLGRTDRTWTYEVNEIEGRDLGKWGLSIASCLDDIESSSPAGVIGADGIEWNVDAGFSSGTFSFELNSVYPMQVVQVKTTTSGNISLTADIIGPNCNSGPMFEADPNAVDGMCLPVIDFETDDAGILLSAGEVIDDEWEGWGVHVTTNDPVNHPAMVFDSANPTGGDVDLGTANEEFGGPGQGDGGRAGSPGENSQPLGKLLIISEDGDSSDPDDNGNGGTMSFTFDMPVHIDDIHLVDVDDIDAVGEFKAYSTQDTSNLITMGESLGLGDNSVQVIPLSADGVRRLDITLPESGGIQSIVSCRNATATLVAIGDRIWADSNDNGVQDSGEVGIPGVELELYLTGENFVVATTTTDLNGEYAFRNLPPSGSAIYDIKVADSNFEAGGVLEGVLFSGQDLGGDETLDSDFDNGNGRATVTVSEASGDNLDIDGGFVVASIDGLPTTATIHIPGTDGTVERGVGCAEDEAGFELNCTANDVMLFDLYNITILDNGCKSEEDTVTFSADFEVTLTAQARYDLGIWFAEDGDPNGDGAMTGTCSVATPSAGPEPDFLDLDGGGDICGDIDDAHNPLFPSFTLTVKCSDPDGDGMLNLPYSTAWRNAGGNELCTSPRQATPGTPSKCYNDPNFEIDIEVPDTTDTTQTTTGNGDCTTFRWLDWDGGTSSNMELMYNMFDTGNSGAWQVQQDIPGGPDDVVECPAVGRVGEHDGRGSDHSADGSEREWQRGMWVCRSQAGLLQHIRRAALYDGRVSEQSGAQSGNRRHTTGHRRTRHPSVAVDTTCSHRAKQNR